MNKRGTETTGGQDVGRFGGRKVFRGSAVKRRRIGDGIGSQGRDEDIAKSPRKKVNVSSIMSIIAFSKKFGGSDRVSSVHLTGSRHVDSIYSSASSVISFDGIFFDLSIC